MSIVRVGLAETKNFAEGYDRIFGKKEDRTQQADSKEETAPSQQAQTQEPQEKK